MKERQRKPYKRLSTIMKKHGYTDKRQFLIDLLERHSNVRDAAAEISMTYQGLYQACEDNGIEFSQEKQVRVKLE